MVWPAGSSHQASCRILDRLKRCLVPFSRCLTLKNIVTLQS